MCLGEFSELQVQGNLEFETKHIYMCPGQVLRVASSKKPRIGSKLRMHNVSRLSSQGCIFKET
jgi:hypothetical protein